MNIEKLYQEFLGSSGISTDSRNLKQNQLFFTLKGELFDANDYVDEALKKGARIVIADRAGMKDKPGVWYVDDALKALQQLASFHRKQWGGTVFAITGSNGKTTTKELMALVLSQKYQLLATEGNLNNHIGVPLSLLKLKKEELAIIEMGANHQGEIRELCLIAKPDTGLITNIGKAHLEGFGGIEGVEKGKGELFDYLAENGKKAVVDGSSEVLMRMAKARNLPFFSYGDLASEVPGQLNSAEERIDGSFMWKNERYSFRSELFGSYNYTNILAAVAAGLMFEVDPLMIVKAVQSYEPQNNRSQRLTGKSNSVIQDAYNANPSSMALSLTAFSKMNADKKMVILGDMYELGKEEQREHEKILELIGSCAIDKVLLVGPRFGSFSRKDFSSFHFFETTEACITYLEELCPKGFTILMKGSRKNTLEKATKCLLDC